MRHPLGLSIGTVRRPLRSALTIASDERFDGVELDGRGELSVQDLGDTGIRQVRKLLEDRRLALHAVEFSTRRGFADEDALDRRIAATIKALRTAWALGTSVVTTGLPDVPEAETPAWTVLVEAATDLGRRASRAGATLAFVPLGQSPETLRRFLTAVSDPMIGIALDPAEAILAGHDPVDLVAEAGERLALVYARDATRGRTGRRGTETPLGRGDVEWEPLLGNLETIGYRGPLVVRSFDTAAGSDASAAAAFLRGVLA